MKRRRLVAALLVALAAAILTDEGRACPPADIGNTLWAIKVPVSPPSLGPDVRFQWALDTGSDSGYLLIVVDDKEDLPDAFNRGGIQAVMAKDIVTNLVPAIGAPTVPAAFLPELLQFKIVGTCCKGMIEGPV